MGGEAGTGGGRRTRGDRRHSSRGGGGRRRRRRGGEEEEEVASVAAAEDAPGRGGLGARGVGSRAPSGPGTRALWVCESIWVCLDCDYSNFHLLRNLWFLQPGGSETLSVSKPVCVGPCMGVGGREQGWGEGVQKQGAGLLLTSAPLLSVFFLGSGSLHPHVSLESL